MNTDGTGFHTCKECHKTESLWNHQTTRKENNWKTEEALARASVTLETERIKGSNPWCLWWWNILWGKTFFFRKSCLLWDNLDKKYGIARQITNENECGACAMHAGLQVTDPHSEYVNLIALPRPPLWSSGQSFWLQIQRSRVRSPSLPHFLSSSGSGTGSTQPREPREVNWGATWMKKVAAPGLENRD